MPGLSFLKRHWQMLVAVLGVVLAAVLLYRIFRDYSLDDLVAAVAAVPGIRLAAAGGFAAASYLLLTGFDHLALRYVGRPLPWRQAATASFVSLSIGHNVGFAGLSSGAIRYRFYRRWGLEAGDIVKLVMFCGVTVALGLAGLAGILLTAKPDLAGNLFGIGDGPAFAVGVAALALVALYLAACTGLRRRVRVRGVELALPPLRLAAAQTGIGVANFLCVAACLHQALSGVAEVAFVQSAVAYVAANIGVLVTHAPGGLGVIESVVRHLVSGADVIGAVLVFRFVYFLVPLALGGATFAVAEAVFRRSPSPRAA
jgi:Predicted integral membrane protein